MQVLIVPVSHSALDMFRAGNATALLSAHAVSHEPWPTALLFYQSFVQRGLLAYASVDLIDSGLAGELFARYMSRLGIYDHLVEADSPATVIGFNGYQEIVERLDRCKRIQCLTCRGGDVYERSSPEPVVIRNGRQDPIVVGSMVASYGVMPRGRSMRIADGYDYLYEATAPPIPPARPTRIDVEEVRAMFGGYLPWELEVTTC